MTKERVLFDRIWIPCEIAMFLGLIMTLWGNVWGLAIALPALLAAIVAAVILTKKEQKECTE